MLAATQDIIQALAVLLMGRSALGIVLWMAGAIYFDVGRGARWSWLPTVAWCLLMAVLFAVWRPSGARTPCCWPRPWSSWAGGSP